MYHKVKKAYISQIQKVEYNTAVRIYIFVYYTLNLRKAYA